MAAAAAAVGAAPAAAGAKVSSGKFPTDKKRGPGFPGPLHFGFPLPRLNLDPDLLVFLVLNLFIVERAR